jgi:hypothetical protein
MLEKNLYARKKAAELMGTDEGTLARSIQKQKLMTKLGAENLMNLSAEQMAPEIEKLRKKFEGNEEKQKQITDLLGTSDTRTTTQKYEQQSLVNQDKTIAAIEASGKIDVGKVGTETLAGMKKADAMINQFNGLAASFGKLSIFSETAAKLNKPLSNLASAIPVFGETFANAINGLTDLIKFNFKTGGTTPVASGYNDALVMNDGLIKFHPSDKFMQVNDSTMIAGTNVDGNKKLARAISGGGSSIDYNKMATAIAMALQHVKVEAVVKTDTLFAATKMNGRRGI